MRAFSRRETGGASSNQSFSVGLRAGRAATWRQAMPAGRGRAPMRQVSDAAPTLTR
jgi:hypothetical protein